MKTWLWLKQSWIHKICVSDFDFTWRNHITLKSNTAFHPYTPQQNLKFLCKQEGFSGLLLFFWCYVNLFAYEVCMAIFPGARIIGVSWNPGPKKGKILSLKLCVSVTRWFELPASQKDTSPLSIFNLIRIRSGRSTCSGVRSFVKAVHTPFFSPIHHTPRFGASVNSFLRATDSLHTPTIHEGLSPTTTSHRCFPEV